MTEGYANQAIQSVLNSQQAYCKFLSANDSGATGGHQSGILISKSAKDMMFTQALGNENILKRTVEIQWQNDLRTESSFTYYSSKNELRITKFGRSFPFLNPEQTGALFVFTRQSADQYSAFFLETEDDIEQFLSAFGIGPTETNHMIDTSAVLPETQERIAIQEFIDTLTVDFPLSDVMSAAARDIQNRVYNHLEYIRTNPDRKIIEWTNTEYALFRAIEHARYGDKISHGFTSVDEFITMANMVLNRRKSRAGKSLEHHLSAIFDGNNIQYTAQSVTEGNKKPDFLFPSQAAYHNATFPTDKLISLAAKTTCKDRWRQVINEADRLRGLPKYLCTLQQGISPAQMDEMQAEDVILVVPRPYIASYPADRRDRIWTVTKFVDYVREVESL
ncbi:type II restriction endonuclease [Phascolarctobacterium succinatutens]|uniref:type II restriction endonuclease n=1 Tax=Phascolarctobacterium succinatutens TaxID=626940 RepID=UPI003AACD83F